MMNVLAQTVEVTDEVLAVVFQDGRLLHVPLTWFPRLAAASPQERADHRLIGGGVGIRWSRLDEDISVESLLNQTREDADDISQYFQLVRRDWDGRTYKCNSCGHLVHAEEGRGLRNGIEAHRRKKPGCFEETDHG